MLHSPCPMVVTLHDLTALKRRSELLRTGARLRLRQLAVQRAVRVIVPTEALAQDAFERLGIEREQIDVIHEAPAACMYPRSAEEIAQARARFGLPERYLMWVGGLQHPDPGKHVAKLAATPRKLPLVLVGPDQRLGARAARRDPHRPRLRRPPRRAVQRRARARRRLRGRGLRAAGRRGAGLRHARRRLRGSRPARGARPARHVRARRRPAGADRRGRSDRASGAGAALVVVAGRRARHLARLRAGARAGRPPAQAAGLAACAAARPPGPSRRSAALSRRRAARSRRGSSSAGSSGRAPATSARGR